MKFRKHAAVIAGGLSATLLAIGLPCRDHSVSCGAVGRMEMCKQGGTWPRRPATGRVQRRIPPRRLALPATARSRAADIDVFQIDRVAGNSRQPFHRPLEGRGKRVDSIPGDHQEQPVAASW